MTAVATSYVAHYHAVDVDLRTNTHTHTHTHTVLCACGRHTVFYWSTHGSDDSLAGYQATAAATEELTAECCDRQQ